MRRNEQPIDLAIELRQHRLAHAGHIFDQEVSLAQQRDEGHLYLMALADDHLFDVLDDRLRHGDDYLGVVHVICCSW